MNNIVIAFPKKGSSQFNQKNISAERLYSHGGCKYGSFSTFENERTEYGNHHMRIQFSDMMYSEIYEYMPKEFQMLLIASAVVSWKKCG